MTTPTPETVSSLLATLGIDRADHDEAVRVALRELVQRRATEAKGARELALQEALELVAAVLKGEHPYALQESPNALADVIWVSDAQTLLDAVEHALALPSPPAAPAEEDARAYRDLLKRAAKALKEDYWSKYLGAEIEDNLSARREPKP